MVNRKQEKILNSETALVSFPLYHGTSSHYLSMFRPGSFPSKWPHQQDAINLIRQAWAELRNLGQEPDWFIDNMLNQVSGSSNWQHGQLYLTPSVRTAVVYARDGARKGGELLRSCAEALATLAQLDDVKAEQLLRDAGSVESILRSDGWPPLLVQFDHVRVGDLLPENLDSDVEDLLAWIVSQEGVMRDMAERQSNFRFVEGCGRIDRVFVVKIEDDGNHMPQYSLKEIHTCNEWR